MIDSAARTKLAQSARWLAAGRITNYQFDDALPNSNDPAIGQLYEKAFWLMYCDLGEHRLIGARRLDPDTRALAARCILFLKSGLPYGWPVLSRWGAARLTAMNLLSLGMAGRRYSARVAKGGDLSVWPFRTSQQYAQALKAPPYLSRL